jgi:putative transposase
LLQNCSDPKDILGKNGLVKQLTKRLVELTLKAELTDHLGYEPHAPEGHGSGNNRNGKSQKTVQSESGPLQIEFPRDRNGTFELQFIKKRQRRLDGFDDRVLALFARGLSTRDIQRQPEEIYGVEVSPTLIANVTDAVMDDMQARQSRPVSAVYPILYFDALFFKTRREGPVMTKAIYLALGTSLLRARKNGAVTLAESEQALARFSERLDAKYPAISPSGGRTYSS